MSGKGAGFHLDIMKTFGRIRSSSEAGIGWWRKDGLLPGPHARGQLAGRGFRHPLTHPPSVLPLRRSPTGPPRK